MMPSPVKIVVTDTNVLINLVHISRLGLCGGLQGMEFIVPEAVLRELAQDDQRVAIDMAIASGGLRVDSMTDLGELATYSDLADRMGKGEAACLAVASARGWSLASDEKGRFRREAVARIGEERLIGTADLLLMGVQAGLLSVEEADEAKVTLESRRFKMPFDSFRDLLQS